MIHEYPLGGKPPMMTHIFQDESGTRIMKGAAEAILKVSKLSEKEQIKINDIVANLASRISCFRSCRV
jgi:Ca2+-transporting ATPase